MVRRTTIELDEDLVAGARRALGTTTMRSTVEEALRQVIERAPDIERQRRDAQMEFLATLGDRLDLDVLASDEMWR